MKLYICIALLIAVLNNANLSQGVVSNEESKLKKAEDAKKEYNDKSDMPGVDRIKEAISDEDKFGKIITWIRDSLVCLRRGTEAKNACYALSDFGIPQEKISEHIFWFVKPYTKKTEKTNLWYERLYNSVAKILLMEDNDSAPILLATKGGDASGERYNAGSIGIGDNKSFSKTSVKGEKVGDSLDLNVEDALNNLPAAVAKVLKHIEDTYDSESNKNK